MRNRPGFVSGAAVAAFVTAPHLYAAEPELAISLDFAAGPGCPSSQAFVEKLHARTPVRVTNEPHALRLHVSLAAGTAGATGQLRSGEAGGSDAREVAAPTCAEVADALALIGALLVERAKRQQAAAPAPVPPKRAIPAPAPAPKPSVPPRPFVTLGLQAVASRPLTTSPLLGAGLSLLVDRGASWWLTTAYARNDVMTDPGAGRFALGAVTLGVGPRPFRLSRALQLTSALAGQGGFVAAEGTNVDISLSVRRSYWAVGILSRLSLEAVDDGTLFLELGGFVPLVERRFSTRAPEELVSATASVAPHVAIGFAVAL